MDTATYVPEDAKANGARAAERFLHAAQPRKVVTVEFPAGPDTEETESFDVEIRGIRARERAEFFRRAMDDQGEALAAYNVDLVLSFCFEPGTDTPFFVPEERDALLDALAGPIEYLVSEIHALSGLDQMARAKAGKGSFSSRNASSTSS